MVSLLVIRRIAWLRSTQRKLTMGLAFSAISKYIEMYTSAVVEVGKSVGGWCRLENRLSRPWGLSTGWTRWRSG